MNSLPTLRVVALLLLVGPVFAAPVVSVPGLVGYWRLDEGASPAADDSGSGNGGAWNNGGASGAAVPAGPPGVGFANPASHFHHYAGLTDTQAVAAARDIWRSINRPNLIENILPTRPRATLVLRKDADHSINRLRLRKL